MAKETAAKHSKVSIINLIKYRALEVNAGIEFLHYKEKVLNKITTY